MFCPHCGTELPDDARFCANCGTPIRSDAEQPASSQAPGQAMQYAAPVAGGQTAPVAGSSAQKKKSPLLIVGICAAVILVAGGFVAFKLMGGKTLSDGSTGGPSAGVSSSITSVVVNGTMVSALAHPMIATTEPDSATGMAASPALADYKTTDESQSSDGAASSDATSGDTSGGASSGASGGATSDNASSGGASTGGGASSGATSDSASSNTSSSSNVVVDNTYGTVSNITPASGLSNVVNLGDFYLSDGQKSLLEQNKFAIDPNNASSEFFDIYESNRYEMLASFVTTDSIMHTYHLYFSHLLKTCEKQYLSANLITLSNAMLQTSIDQLDTLSGTEWQDAATRNVTYFAVACRLLDPTVEVPSSVESTVDDEVAKIQEASQTAECAITGDQEDYSQYKPRGYYEGDAQLESYFRAMMWYGHINFTEKNEDLDRSALLITLALDGGTGGTVNANWEANYTVTSFFAGASDDMSYYEYYPLFAYSYGEGATVDSLAGNTDAWNTYHGLTATMPAPKISSVIVGDEAQVTDDDTKGFRFMGQRFSIDESIFQQLVYDNVGTEDNARLLPAALDLPAALGSDTALSILDQEGETSYANYNEQMQAMRGSIANSDDSIWSASLYSQWLYTLNPLLVSKGAGYPEFMQSAAWDQKNLQSYLGSYTELKHDTVLYSKQVMVEMGGGTVDNDDRGYVEPEPELYARLANLTQATSDGLTRYGMLSSDDASNMQILHDLVVQLQTISEKELAGQSLTSDEYDLIRTYGGQLEHFWETVNPSASSSSNHSNESPAAVVVDVATDGTDGTVLELATGKVSSIYVLVPIDGELHLCRGGVFTYYEFEQPQSDRLTDSTWRGMLGITGSSYGSASVPAQPAWTQAFEVAKRS